MTIQVRSPQISVKLLKNVGRKRAAGRATFSQRFSGRQHVLELSPWLGERGNVTVSKSVREPAGTFSITLTDMVNSATQDSLYGMIEPMDCIEIRMSAEPHRYPNKLPIMMRGFVSEVRRQRAAQPDGKVSRVVTITGHDYGKIWQIFQVFYNPVDKTLDLLTKFPLFTKYGLTQQTVPVKQFVTEIVSLVLNPFIQKMKENNGADSTTSPLLELSTGGVESVDGTAGPCQLGNTEEGSVYSILHKYCDCGPWTELFIRDDESGPVVVYRNNPFKKADGSGYITKSQKAPNVVTIKSTDIVSIDVGRSDADVANYFWVTSAMDILGGGLDTLKFNAFQSDIDTIYLSGDSNSSPRLYGVRKMEEATGQLSTGMATVPLGVTKDDQSSSVNSMIEWMKTKRVQVIESNVDNVVFETGSVQLKGNESIKAGTYVEVGEGTLKYELYAYSVRHSFTPFGAYTTSVSFDRGTGFIERSLRNGGAESPYWSELAQKQ